MGGANDSSRRFSLRSSSTVERLLECVHCGLCLPACPTYLELGNEADSPRGRIHLMRAVAEGTMALDAEVVRHIDLCLGCLGCETACPSGVRYHELIETARVAVEQSARRPWWQRVRRQLILRLFPYPSRLAALLWSVRMADRAGLGSWLRRLPIAELLPELSEVGVAQLPPRIPANGPPRFRVALLRGCVSRVLFPNVERAILRLLAAGRCEVIVPPSQGCCGALAAHQGSASLAAHFVQHTLAAFGEPVDAILLSAAGCSAFLRNSERWLESEADRARARTLGACVRDVTEFLAKLDLPRPSQRFPYKVAYHHACHLAHAQGIREEPLRLLELAGAELVTLEEADVCCGSAGSYNLLEPDLARRLGTRKARKIAASGAEVVAVANPGCALQIRAALRRLGQAIPVLHPVEILDAAYRGDLVTATGARGRGSLQRMDLEPPTAG